ncbi:UDP-2,3-diacetamido-2,3-dideoxy-D-glucuronate 2-epimerase [Oxobacter pfennigii]|uniref:UDP-2,3-diacetamido-2,3-dideoxy-D-glucuronate 2-epimerase n=1 Tax=Oxobacter pfennigii TaxID=36849 RepID=A0A0P8YDN9_9CLOT|nr:UDP-N-acetylglucosamine 2-epimerase (non-hydrolyzing) [Oxobacter pfennigii]KPU45364.1 UDP-2,3-diacetamido-2,3-dideoxy-D-glucuronate 2-epimerase [Oxobacter pfennigii]
MKILTVIGARPQFIKAAPVSQAIRKKHDEVIIHTGQHYDDNMSKIFFEELNIPAPDYNLNIGSGNHGYMTGMMLIKIEEIVLKENPDALMVYGDTNSTLAGALAASKLHIPVVHIEAGLRSFNMAMPEEQNRILTDHISKVLFCPTYTAVKNLEKEGIIDNIYNVGDVMLDATLHFKNLALKNTEFLREWGIENKDYILATIHRAENTDNRQRLQSIINALNNCQKEIILPLHPRTRKFLGEYGIETSSNIKIIDPVGYLDMIRLESHALKIITDSGGVQKEAFFLKVPCITLRDETEWVETVQNGWNIIVGSNEKKIVDAIKNFTPAMEQKEAFGDGKASEKISEILYNTLQ